MKKRFSAEQIIAILKDAETGLAVWGVMLIAYDFRRHLLHLAAIRLSVCFFSSLNACHASIRAR